MMIAHVVVTERTGQNMLESVLYSIKGFFDSALKSVISLKASEVTVKHPWLRGRHGMPMSFMSGIPSCIRIPRR